MPYTLIVDDEAAIRRIVNLSLAGEDIDFKLASSGAEALQLIRDEQPALLVLDFRLDDMPCADVITAARDLGYIGPILLFTGWPGDPGLPVDAILQKPFDPDDLVSTIRRYLK